MKVTCHSKRKRVVTGPRRIDTVDNAYSARTLFRLASQNETFDCPAIFSLKEVAERDTFGIAVTI